MKFSKTLLSLLDREMMKYVTGNEAVKEFVAEHGLDNCIVERSFLGSAWFRVIELDDIDHATYRVSLEKNVIITPWTKLSEIPKDNWFRRIGEEKRFNRISEASIINDAVYVRFGELSPAYNLKALAIAFEHSYDGENWFPCGRAKKGQ